MTSPVRPAEGLLEQIAEHALDDDYYVVRAGEPYRERSTSTALVGVVAAVLAAMLTIAAVQTQSNRAGNDLERRTLAADVEARREVLAAQERTAETLRDQVDALRGGGEADVRDLGVVSGSAPARGEGLVVTLAPSASGGADGVVTARDVVTVVNGLWYAGAEAIAIDGQRLASTSSIRSLEGAITVNYTRVDPPLRIVALGDAAAMRDRFENNDAGTYLALRADATGLRSGVAPSDDESVPGAPEQRTLPLHARPLADASDVQEVGP